MKSSSIYQRKIIGVEKKGGFLYIPAQAQDFMPVKSGKVLVFLEDTAAKFTYNANHKRIFGLTKWYNKYNVNPGTLLNVQFSKEGIKLSIAKHQISTNKDEEAMKVINLSGLSSGAKGNIVEDRIKELILLYGQGLLNVFKPVVDNRGIDLVVMKNGFFYPIFIQVKSRFNAVQKGSILIDVSGSTFSAHNSFYIIGAVFNPSTLEIEDRILFIPSKDYESSSTITKKNNKKRFTVSLKKNTKSKGAVYFIRKSELVEKLMEKFEEMEKYYK